MNQQLIKLADIHTHFPEKSIADICIGAPLADRDFSVKDQMRQAAFSLQNNIPYSIGIHPWQAAVIGDDFEEKLLQLSTFFSQNKKKFVMGEIGLDSYKANLQKQKIIFEKQLDIATENHCPVVILHCVKTLHLLPPILEKFRKKNNTAIIILHGFCGSMQEAEKLNNYDIYFSFSAKILANSKKTAIAATIVTENRILTETDMDKPETLYYVLSQLSSIRKQKIEDLAVDVFNNTKRICRFLTEENT